MVAKACVVIEVLRERIPLFCSRPNFLDDLALKRLLSGLWARKRLRGGYYALGSVLLASKLFLSRVPLTMTSHYKPRPNGAAFSQAISIRQKDIVQVFQIKREDKG